MSAPLDWSSKEGIRARAIVISGVIFAIYLVPWREGAVETAILIWRPQPIILFFMMGFLSRPAAISGVAAILALYPIAFVIWVFLSASRGMVELLYFFSLPAAGLGALAGTAILGQLSSRSELAAASFTAALTLAGLFLNLILTKFNVFGW